MVIPINRIALLALALACSIVAATAAEVPNPPMEKVLLPIAVAGELPGAFGSRWATRVAVTNKSATEVAIYVRATDCSFDPCVRETPRVQPGATIYPDLGSSVDVPGTFLYVEEGRAGALAIQLGAYDVSREELSWGTEIPVVRQSQAFTDSLALVDIPVDSRFRLMLRVYDLDSAPTSSVQVRVYRLDPESWNPDDAIADPLIFEFPLTLHGEIWLPGYAQVDFGSIQELSGLERIRVEVIPTSPQLRFWAFVSVTNNETQHFTTITPQ